MLLGCFNGESVINCARHVIGQKFDDTPSKRWDVRQIFRTFYLFLPRNSCVFSDSTSDDRKVFISAFESNQRLPTNTIRSSASSTESQLHEHTTAFLPITYARPLTSSNDLQRVLFELQDSPFQSPTPQLPHKSHLGVLPFPGEDSDESRHLSLVRLGFAPFKPP